jgi:hypothetical protein
MDTEELAIFKAYKTTFTRKEGQLVLMDLEAAYLNGLNSDVETMLSDIPHPYNEYVLKGMRTVIQNIKAAMELADAPMENEDGSSSP